jgi:hypothetical protein
MHYSFLDYAVAFFALFVFIAWVAFAGTRIGEWFAQINSPKDSPDILVQQMFAENVSVNKDPTIPVGDFNPKHSAQERRLGR